MEHLADTNILLRSIDQTHPMHGVLPVSLRKFDSQTHFFRFAGLLFQHEALKIFWARGQAKVLAGGGTRRQGRRGQRGLGVMDWKGGS